MTEERASFQQSSPPGERLKLAREQFGWSVHETAEKLHVIPRYVKAIENADYAQLPGLVFLKGYIRSYARLMGLPEAPLIEDLAQDLLSKDHPILQQVAASAGPFAEEEVKSRRLLWYSLAFLIIAVMAYFVWANYAGWFAGTGPKSDNESLQSENPANRDTEQMSGTERAVDVNSFDNQQSSAAAAQSDGLVNSRVPATGELPLEIDLNRQRESEGQTTGSAVNQTEPDSADLSSGNTAEPGSDAATAAVGTSQPLLSDQQVAGRQTNNNATAITGLQRPPGQDSGSSADTDTVTEALDGAADNVIPDNPVEAGNEAQQNIAGLVTVEAIFSGDCWFDLRDRDNDRIVGLYRSGDSVTFNGQYPLQFIVGAVNAVTIKVNGRILNFNDYPVKNNRAQFTLAL